MNDAIKKERNIKEAKEAKIKNEIDKKEQKASQKIDQPQNYFIAAICVAISLMSASVKLLT